MKKTKKKAKKSMKKAKPNKEVAFINTLLKYTERNILNNGLELDEFFKGQAERLKKRLEEVK
jgi:hypothetical protein